MFAGFNLEIDETFFDLQPKSFAEYQKKGEKHLKLQDNRIEESLEQYITNNIIDGSRIQKEWFPEIEADIFLSHSSHDQKLANALAGWINDTFGLYCFVDSNVWGSAMIIVDKLNEKFGMSRTYSENGVGYDHQACLKISEHVNMMLSVALLKMIDKCECIFLLNTQNSVNVMWDSIGATYSAWIYAELIYSELVRRKSLETYRYSSKLDRAIRQNIKDDTTNHTFEVLHNIPTEHLINISADVLVKWKKQFDEKTFFPLDLLYIDYYKEDVENVKKYCGYI